MVPQEQNTPSGPLQRTATEQTLDLYARGEDGSSGLKKEMKDADTERKVAIEREIEAINNQEFKWCLVQKSEAALTEYEGLFNGVTVVAKQDAVEIDKTIGQFVEQSAKVKTTFSDLNKTLQGLKASLAVVETTTYQISELLENSGPTALDEELKWLKNHVPNFLDRIWMICGDTGEKNYKPRRQARQGLADVVYDLADDAFEISVYVTGISQAANVLSLTDLSKALVSDISDVHADVAAGVAFAQAQKQEAQGQLTQMLIKQRATRAEKFRKEHQHTALQNTLSFVKEPDCKENPEEALKELERIQKKVENSF